MTLGNRHFQVIALLGPTAAGKSKMAVHIASCLEAEIVCVDSMQVYRGMDIGTAKPDSILRQQVPHHLLDIVHPINNFSVAEFQETARRIIEDIAGFDKLPFLVGGTGLYFESVVFDLQFPPGSIDDLLRRRLEEWAVKDPEGMRRRLRELDPGFSSATAGANMRRVIRAMEVYERTGFPISSFQSQRGNQRLFYPYTGAVINAPRYLLNQAIDSRVDSMIEAGLVDEVRMLLQKGGFSQTARQALGYKEIIDYLDRGIPLEETILNIKQRTRRYAKRQLTWFRRIPGLQWFNLKEEDFTISPPPTTWAVRDYLVEQAKAKRDRE